MDLFSINSKFFHFMYQVADLMILSILWLLFSLPVVTIGISSSALYYCVVKVVREEGGSPTKLFWQAFRDNWKQGLSVTGLVLGILLLASAAGTAVYALSGSLQNLTGIYTAYLVLALSLLGWLHFVFSYIGRFEAPLKTVLKNSLLICIANLPYAISMVVLFGAVVGGWLLLFPASAMFLLLLPGVYCWLTSFLLERIYRKYLPEEEA